MTGEAGAAALWDARVVRPLSKRENAVWEVALPDGARAALRLHRPGYQSEAAIRSELWWCGALAARGLPVPAPVPRPDGALTGVAPSGRVVSVVSWVEGEPIGAAGVPLAGTPAAQAEVHHALGRLLARIHAATDALVPPPWFTRPRWDREGLVGEAPLWGRFWEHPALSPTDRGVLLAARGYLSARLDGPLAPIHADVLRENVLAGPRGLSLIDFDDSGTGLRLYDLGTVLSQCLGEPAFPEIRAALMQGYGTADLAAVEAMTLMRCCASVGWTMPRLPPGHPIHASHIARAVGLARRLV